MEENVFSNHVRACLDGDLDSARNILPDLHQIVRARLQAIGQWNLPPKYLGYDGESWEQSDALDDLVQDVYLVCIQKRLDTLAQHLEATGSCDGSVHWKLHRFLLDRQEKGNPIARRVFRNVRNASESLIERGTAESSQDERLTSTSIVLAVGQDLPDDTEKLSELFAGVLNDSDFLKLVHRESPSSWRMIETAVESQLSRGMRGYRIGDLSKVFADACKRPGVIPDAETESDDGQESVLKLLSDPRTLSPDSRYLEKDQLESLVVGLARHAEATVRNSRIRERVLNMLSALTELIRQGEDLRQLTRRKLADQLDVSKSTLAEDFARLQTYDWMQEASESELES